MAHLNVDNHRQDLLLSSLTSSEAKLSTISPALNALNWIPTDGLDSANLLLWMDPSKRNFKDNSVQENLGFANRNPFNNRSGFYDSGLDLAYDFDGVTDYVLIPFSSGLQPNNHITVEAWVFVRDTSTTQQIIRGSDDGSNFGYTFSISGGNFSFFLREGSSNYSTTTPASMGWHHLVGTWDGTDQKLYLDSDLVASTPRSITSLNYGSNNDTIIGAANTSGSFDLDGALGRIRVWEEARNQQDVLDLHNNYSGLLYSQLSNEIKSGLVASWELDETSGNAIDSHSSFDGTVNDATQGASGLGENTLDFNGVDNDVEVEAASKTYSQVSIFCWVNPSSLSGFTRVCSFAPTNEISLLFNGNKLNYQINNQGQLNDSNTAVSLDQWQLVGMTFDSTTNELIYYVDGVADSNVITETIDPGAVTDLLIGRASSSSIQFFDGEMDDLVITDDIVSPAEFSSIFNGGVGADPSGIVDNIVHYFKFNEVPYSPKLSNLGSSGVSGDLTSFHSVNQVDDLSGNSDHGTQVTASKQPSIKEISGVRMLDFNGTSGIVDIPVSAIDESQFSIFCVIQNKDLVGLQFALSAYSSAGGTPTRIYLGSDSSTAYARAGGATDSGNIETKTINTSDLQIACITGESGTLRSFLDNEAEESGLFSNSGVTDLSIGAFKSGVTENSHFNGYIGDVIIYDRELSLEDRNTVFNYLTSKYSL